MQKLLKAIENDSLAEIKKLLSNGCYDLNSKIDITEIYSLDEEDELPLIFYLIQSGISLEALELLVNAGLDITYTSKEGLSALDYAIKHRRKDIVELCRKYGLSLVKSSRKSGLTPLMLAASFNDVEMMKFLIANGADVNEKDKYGMSAKDYAKRLGQGRAEKYLNTL